MRILVHITKKTVLLFDNNQIILGLELLHSQSLHIKTGNHAASVFIIVFDGTAPAKVFS